MSYLKFDKSLMINLEQSLPKEMLRTNKSGAYHCTSIVGCNTRKQHGLLVIPIPDMDDKAHVLLSSLDETVIQHDVPFNLGIHQYSDNIFNPGGHKYIREFNCERVPTLTFRVGGVILTKEKVFISHENRILIKYTLKEAHSPTTLRFRPFPAFRNANDLCIENSALDPRMHVCKGGISCCLYPGYPSLFMEFNKEAKWVDAPYWYKGIEYYKDRNRGLPYKEDLYSPGYFELPITKGESVIFSASTFECDPIEFEQTFEAELNTRTCRTSFYNCLKNAAEQFYLKKKNGTYIMVGYPWYNVRSRDELIALPGCTLAIGRKSEYETILHTFLKAWYKYINEGIKDSTIKEIDLPDIPLWCIWTIMQYKHIYGLQATREEYGMDVKRIIDAIFNHKVPNLSLEDNGLVSTDGHNVPVSWLSASIDGKPIIPRSGLLLEFNALWYNALSFLLHLYDDNNNGVIDKPRLEFMREKCGKSFIDTFLNEHGYLYDYVDGNYADLQVRPNMAIAIGMDYSPLNRSQRRSVIDFITRELLTPKGLRTLSPKSEGYTPNYVGSPIEREYAVHRGPARPWLFGFYADAYIRVFGYSGIGFIERMMIGFEDEMSEGCIGSLSEMYDGNPPYKGRGAVSTAKNVGEILRTLNNIKRLNIQQETQSEG